MYMQKKNIYPNIQKKKIKNMKGCIENEWVKKVFLLTTASFIYSLIDYAGWL